MEIAVSETATTSPKEYWHDILHTKAVGRLLLIVELIVVVYEYCDVNVYVQYQRKIIAFFYNGKYQPLIKFTSKHVL